MGSDEETDRFLEEAQRQGRLGAEAAAECRKLAGVLADVGTAVPIAELAVRRGFLTREQSNDILRALTPRQIGRYEILDRLGSGGVGVVWRARDASNGAVVALKILGRRAGGAERVRERFLREARVSLTLEHPNIVRGLDSGEAAGYTYLALEFVPGGSLADRIAREGRVEEAEALRIAREVVRALEHIRQFKLVHHDIKPANVMITPDGAVKLCDLGLTRPTLQEAKELGVEETPLGTATYVAPEQIERPDTVDWRADVYGLGATLYHALTGAPPFEGADAAEVAHKRLTTAARDPRERVVELSEGAATVVLKMLHRDPTKRYASLADLAEDLESVRAGKVPVHTLAVAPVAPAAPRAPHAPREHAPPRADRRAAGLVVGVAVLAAGVAGWLLLRGGGTTPHAPTAPRETGAGPAPAPAPGPPTAAAPAARAEPPSDAGARAALAAAIEFQKANPETFDGCRRRFEDVTAHYAGTSSAEEARAALQRLEEARTAAAQREYDARAARAADAEKEGRLRDAAREFREFRPVFAGLPQAAKAAAETRRIEDAARAALASALDDARRSAAAMSFSDARRALERAALCALSESDPALAATRDHVDVAEKAHVDARTAGRAAFEECWADTLLAAGRGDGAAARALVDARRAALAHFSAELAALPGEIADVERVAEAARRRWRSLTGQKVKLTTPRRPPGFLTGTAAPSGAATLALDCGSLGRVEVPVDQVAAPEVVALAAPEMQRSAADQQALFLYALARGDTACARGLADAVRDAGGDAAAASDAIACMHGRLEKVAAGLLSDAALLRRQSRLPEARAAAEEATRLVPEDAAAQVALAAVLVESQAWDDARAAAERALALKDAPAEAHLRLAQALGKRGDLERAQAEYRSYAQAAAPDDPLRAEAQRWAADVTARLNKTLLDRLEKDAARHLAREQWTELEADCTQILAIDAADADASWRLGRAYLRQSKVFAAFKQLTLFTREHPKHAKAPEALRDLALINERYRVPTDDDRETARDAGRAFEREFLDDAVTQYRKALATSPFLAEARLGLGQALLARALKSGSKDDLRATVAEMDDLLFVDADDAGGLVTRAWALLELGDAQRALADAEHARKTAPGAVEPMLAAGHARLRLGAVDEAEKLFDEAYRKEPGPAARYGTALVLEQRGRNAEALKILRESLDAARATPSLRTRIAQAIARLSAAGDGR